MDRSKGKAMAQKSNDRALALAQEEEQVRRLAEEMARATIRAQQFQPAPSATADNWGTSAVTDRPPINLRGIGPPNSSDDSDTE